MSIEAYIYRLFDYYITKNVEAVKSVDLYFDQFTTESEGETDATSNPKVLIEIEEFETVKMFGGVQNAEVPVVLHIGIDIFNTFKTAELKDKNLGYLDLLENIYTGISGISSFNLPDEFKDSKIIIHNIERSGVIPANNTGSIKVSQIRFDLIVEDNNRFDIPVTDEIEGINTNVTFE